MDETDHLLSGSANRHHLRRSISQLETNKTVEISQVGRITAIKAQVKTAGRYSIFVDGTYAFSLSEDQLVEEKLRLGQSLDAAEVTRLQRESDFGKHYLRMRDLVLRRPRSEWELRQYITRKGWDADEAERLLNKLRTRKYADDVVFAEFWIRNRSASGRHSLARIRAELQTKRVASDIIDQALTTSDETPDDVTTIRTVVAKRAHRYDDPRKLIAYLARQGFRYDDIMEAAKESETL